jgi:hypothetical protein
MSSNGPTLAHGTSPKERAELLLGIAAALGALRLNLALGHPHDRTPVPRGGRSAD